MWWPGGPQSVTSACNLDRARNAAAAAAARPFPAFPFQPRPSALMIYDLLENLPLSLLILHVYNTLYVYARARLSYSIVAARRSEIDWPRKYSRALDDFTIVILVYPRLARAARAAVSRNKNNRRRGSAGGTARCFTLSEFSPPRAALCWRRARERDIYRIGIRSARIWIFWIYACTDVGADGSVWPPTLFAEKPQARGLCIHRGNSCFSRVREQTMASG